MANEKRLDLIDRNAIKYREITYGGWGRPEYVVDKVVIDKMPTVDAVEVKHGRWVNAAGARTICNNCGEYPLYDYFGRQKFSYYCPNCGAKMDGDGNG